MRTIAIVCLLILESFLVCAQSGDNRQTYSPVICEYTIPLSRKGLSVTSFWVTPKIYLDRFEKSAQIILDISKVQGTAANPNPSFKYSYNYNGRQYGNETLGFDVFNSIVASDITYEVLVSYGSKSWGWMKVDGKTNQFGPVDKNAKASDINVRVKVVGIGSFSGTGAIDAKIQSLLNSQKTAQNPSTPRAPVSAVEQQTMAKGKINTAATNGTVPQNRLPKDGSVKKTAAGAKETSAAGNVTAQKSSSEQLKDREREDVAAAEREKQRLVDQANYAAYQAQLSLERAKEEKRKVDAQVITQAAGLAGELLGDWQASRERKWAREKEENQRHSDEINRDRVAYNSFVRLQDNQIKGNLKAYQAQYQRMLPKVLASGSISWEDIIGSPDYNQIFGKDVKAVGRKLKLIFPKEKAGNGFSLVDPKELPIHFSHGTFYNVESGQSLFYWVKSDFYEHNQSFIINEKNVIVGITIGLHTAAHENKSFPSSMSKYLPINEYIEDLKKNTKGAYFQADGKTWITKDKLFILDFDYLTIYDLNFFASNTLFNFPFDFKQYFGTGDCAHCAGKLGISFEGIRPDKSDRPAQVQITQVAKGSAAEKAGLLPGDYILDINGLNVNFPFHLQWYFLAFPEERKLLLTIKRANKLEKIHLTL